jgi:hypothetical protein
LALLAATRLLLLHLLLLLLSVSEFPEAAR